jgi:hypothetical protein
VTTRLRLAGAGVALVLLLAVVSTARGLSDTWDFLSSERSAYADLTAAQPNLVPQFQALLPAQAAAFFEARMTRGDRYYVQVAPGTFFTGVDLPTAVRTFARYFLLPEVAVRDPREADVVLSVNADPHALGLSYARVERDPSGRYTFARIAR